ncbi:MAG: dienelactone hydrolase family protein, partial [Acidimicrobiia bacterium]|nr:dienelactone hydrolase family protein [Acidimicrobiia bacterium]
MPKRNGRVKGEGAAIGGGSFGGECASKVPGSLPRVANETSGGTDPGAEPKGGDEVTDQPADGFDPLTDFEKTTFTHVGKTRDIYRKGSGPAVIVMAEIPGITPKVARFARHVVDIGCTAIMPVLFGTPGRPGFKGSRPDVPYVVSSIGPACVSKEFAALARGRTAPVTNWLRALAAHEFEVCGGKGVGAVGMCFTGGFALGMMVDEHVLAPVLSQPSLPIGPSAKKKADLHLSPEDLARVKQRIEQDDVCVLGVRFTGDKLSPPERFASLRRELGDGFIGVEI